MHTYMLPTAHGGVSNGGGIAQGSQVIRSSKQTTSWQRPTRLSVSTLCCFISVAVIPCVGSPSKSKCVR